MQSASVKSKCLYVAALMPKVKAYFLLPQNCSFSSTATIFTRVSLAPISLMTSRVLSVERSLIKTIQNWDGFALIKAVPKFVDLQLRF